MTVKECIHLLDISKPNQFSPEDKYRWLTYLENKIIDEVFRTHHPVWKRGYRQYNAENVEEELLVKEPYAELYVAFLKMKIDEENGETQRYNNSATFFNAYYEDFQKWWHRNHAPAHRANIYL